MYLKRSTILNLILIIEEKKLPEKTKVQFGIKDSIKFGFGFGIGTFIWGILLVIIIALILNSMLHGMGGSPYGY